MKYRLYENATNDTSNIIKEILNNRGISDYKTYLNLTNDVEIHYSNLDNIELAVDTFSNHFSNKNIIGVLVDCDVDGYTSASIMYKYIKLMDANYPLKYILHTKSKAHGLSDDVIIDNDIKLLIIPDAASNDVEQCKALKSNGVDIIILDHHEIEKENPYAIVVNNMKSDKYYNKNLSGVGIVYKFLQALDDYYWNEYADEFIDLVALGNIGDMMDIRSFETKYLINKGLSNIKNKCFNAFIKAQEYSINGKINIHNIQWYIVPVLNALIRIGSYEERELLFRAFVEQDEFFEYKTRATKDKPSEVIKESIYERAARLCKNAKSRQDNTIEKNISVIMDKIENECDQNDKIIIVDGTDIVDNGLIGVMAMKIADIYNKPCILINKCIENNEIKYSGSARNTNNSPIVSLKDIINTTHLFELAQGHNNAFGIKLKIDKVNKVKEKLNELLKDVVYENTYIVDFILSQDEVTAYLINEISKLNNIIGQGIDECRIAVENLVINKKDIQLLGKESNTITFVKNNIKYIQFKCRQGNLLFDWINDTWDENNTVEINLVGKPNVNEYGSIKMPQIMIDDFNIIRFIKSYNEDEDSIW